MNNDSLSFIPLGGVGDVTRNMYVYEYQDQILLVDCGLGFADETMLGVDLLLPDISYLLNTVKQNKKKIVGMILTHGHEDHIGALPFVLPQLPSFPIFATPLTAALANAKLQEFNGKPIINSVDFNNPPITLGSFLVSFIRITHSVPDTSNLFIETPIGNFYHASDFKFDLTPHDGKKTDFQKIVGLSQKGVLCLMSDCLGAERAGFTPSEEALSESFEREMQRCKGKFIVTTYSSNISRLNQAIEVSQKFKKKVCFVGRSLIKAKDVALQMGILKLLANQEITIEQVRSFRDNEILLFVAGSQGQENSAMTRIANNEHKNISLGKDDVVVFSSDPIPGNEVSVNFLVDTLARKVDRVVYSGLTDKFHVSGHGSKGDLMLMASLVAPTHFLPIGGTFRQMVAYKNLIKKLNYPDHTIALVEDGQEIIFTKEKMTWGKKIAIRNVYLDQTSGEEVANFVLRDRQKISLEGIVIVIVEIDSATGGILEKPEVISRGFAPQEANLVQHAIIVNLASFLPKQKERVVNWMYLRKHLGEAAEKLIFKAIRRNPLVLPVVIEA